MHPIEFQCIEIIPATASVICDQIADVARWSEFRGYGPLPGIKSARYDKRTDTMVGSRVLVQNTDGSRHVEEISAWVAGSHIGMRLQEFSPPLSTLATHFTEDWLFQANGPETQVTRTVRMYPRNWLTWPAVWVISLLFRPAIAQNLRALAVKR